MWCSVCSRQVFQFFHQSPIPPSIINSPWFSSSFVFISMGESILLYPSISVSESKSSTYFLCDRRMSFLSLAALISKKHFRNPRFLVWNCFYRFFFRLSIPFMSSPMITLPSTYTISKILFSWCIRQNTEWYFSHRQRPKFWITDVKRPNQALGDYFRPSSDFFNLQTFAHSFWATEPGSYSM